MLKQRQTFFSATLLILIILLTACSSQPNSRLIVPPLETSATKNAHETLLLNLITTLRNNNNTANIGAALLDLDSQALNKHENQLLLLAKAQYAFSLNDKRTAQIYLESLHSSSDVFSGNTPLKIIDHQLYATVIANSQYLKAAKLRMSIAPFISQQDEYLSNHRHIWQLLAKLNKEQLKQARMNTPDTILKQWLTLRMLARHNLLMLNSQIKAINDWQESNPIHPAALIPPFEIAAIRIAAQKRPNVIAVLLPFEGKYSRYGKAIRDGLMSAFYQTDYRPKIMFYSVKVDQNFVDFYNDAINDGAELIIGPLFKPQLEALYNIETINNTLAVPTIALNKLHVDTSADKTLAPRVKPRNLIEYSLSRNDEVSTLIRLTNHLEFKRAVIIGQNEKWAKDDAQTFTRLFNNNGGEVLNTQFFNTNKEQSKIVQQALSIDKSKSRIKKLRWALGNNILAEPRRRQDIDSIILLAKPKQATTLRPILSFHYANDISLLSTSAIYRGYSNSFIDKDLNGIIFTDLPLITKKNYIVSRYYQRSKMIRMYGFGIDAFSISRALSFDATTA